MGIKMNIEGLRFRVSDGQMRTADQLRIVQHRLAGIAGMQRIRAGDNPEALAGYMALRQPVVDVKVTAVDMVASVPCESKMILIKAGSFSVKGSYLFGDKNPAADRITISRDFELGEYPVMVAEFREFAEATGHLAKISGEQGADELRDLLADRSKDRHPVVYVNEADREAYAAWKGERYFVPTAAEWELMARGSEGRLFPYGNKWKEAPYYNKNKTFPVDSFPEGGTPEGISGLGIVWEAMSTRYGDYDPKVTTDPKGPDIGDYLEMRGGSAWCSDRRYFHGASRGAPVSRSSSVGFRVAARTLK